jgi:hypothetical protein
MGGFNFTTSAHDLWLVGFLTSQSAALSLRFPFLRVVSR